MPLQHVIDDVDPAARTGTCSLCGPGSRVHLSYRGSGRWLCDRRAGKRRSTELAPRHYLSKKDVNRKTAVCSVCGPTTLQWRGDRWQCKSVYVRLRPSAVAYREANKERLNKISRTRKFGITVEQLDAATHCDICRRAFVAQDGNLRKCIDHDHVTGRFRGFLCHDCNVTLGHARDDAALLRRAADYLETAPFRTLGLP